MIKENKSVCNDEKIKEIENTSYRGFKAPYVRSTFWVRTPACEECECGGTPEGSSATRSSSSSSWEVIHDEASTSGVRESGSFNSWRKFVPQQSC
jgi:hypothetical protein